MAPWWEMLTRMILAAFLGGLLGWERQTRGKPAGFRTLMLVSLSAAVFVMASEQASRQAGEPVEAGRLMAGIAQGIGFLGAGAILQARGEVRWLTTAAALWGSAALGFAAGLGLYVIAGMAGLFVFATLHWMTWVERRWMRQPEDGPTDEHRHEDGAH
jgi:putative Mg2+ transporter-C (MgtC) family protein